MQELENSAGVGLLGKCRDVRERAGAPSASGVGHVQGTEGAPWQPFPPAHLVSMSF